MKSRILSASESLNRLRGRFEIAVSNFGRSCIAMQSNEKAFQGWFAACVIQEFGLSRVYREVHLDKKELFTGISDQLFVEDLRTGNELFPDLSISWEPDVDTRHTSNRDCSASEMLSQMAIVSEFKVTGSTSVATPHVQILRDLQKLSLFSMAAGGHTSAVPRGLATYMVVLDNFNARKPHLLYAKERLATFISDLSKKWPVGIDRPTILLLSPSDAGCVMHRFSGPEEK